MDEVKVEEVTPESNEATKPKRGRPRRAFPVAEKKYGEAPVEHPTVVLAEPVAPAKKPLSQQTLAEIEAGKRAVAKKK